MAVETLNADLEKISRWAATWLVTFNSNKSIALLLSRKVSPAVFMGSTLVNEVEGHKHLGLYLSNNCTWHQHIKYIKEKVWVRINIMRRLKYKFYRKLLESKYISIIRPLLEYGDTIWDNCI